MLETQTHFLPQVDEHACITHGDCVDIAPEVFRLEGEVAEVIGDGPSDLILKASEACPSVAIIVTDVETGEQIFP